MINSILDHYSQKPDHRFADVGIQGNNLVHDWLHAAPVLGDIFEGVKGFDAQSALRCLTTTAIIPFLRLASYRKLGWVPCDKRMNRFRRRSNTPTTRLIATNVRSALAVRGPRLVHERSASFKKHYGSSIGWMRSKDSRKAVGRTSLTLISFGGGKSFRMLPRPPIRSIPCLCRQDVPGLISMMVGNENSSRNWICCFGAKQSEAFTHELSGERSARAGHRASTARQSNQVITHLSLQLFRSAVKAADTLHQSSRLNMAAGRVHCAAR